jgi:alkanesulfonate monooxygenase SsuD/methylene tetrahydromethanopterin reductase-like flavin-dependent oxidoreductase (luciferase family)
MVNIWPRPYQEPHPPVWVSTTSPGGASQVGSRGFVQATFLTGFEGTRAIYNAYRKGWRAAGRQGEVPIDRLAYAALVYTGETEAKAWAGAEKLLWYVTGNKVLPHFSNPPGYVPVAANVQMARGATHPLSEFSKGASVERAIQSGMMFAGTPDQVYAQVKKLYDFVGGFGHLLLMGQAGHLDHEETKRGTALFAREVFPRLKQDYPDKAISVFVTPELQKSA